MHFRRLLLLGLFVLLPLSASAQSPDSLSVQEAIQLKDPGTATLLSVVLPGGGQLYAQDMGKGTLHLSVAAASGVAGALRLSAGRRPLLSGSFYVLNWLASAVLASTSAEEYNAQLLSRTVKVNTYPVASTHGPQAAIGVQVQIGF